MRKPALLFFLLFSTLSLFSQRNYYWIKFKDKNNNSYSLNNPAQFLSQRSIDRRTTQHLNLDSTDLPLTQKYVDSIAPFITELKHRLKWLNCVVVKIDSTANLDSLKQFSFIDSIGGIEFFPSRAFHQQNKFEETFPVDQRIVYPNKYGAAYRQINMLNADLLHQMGYRGNGIIIAMMDNGFHNINTNPAFDSVRNKILFTRDFVNNEDDVNNEGDHGAQTFSCIGSNLPNLYVGTAPESNFILNQTEDNGAEWVMEEYNWAVAAEIADSAGADIFSTSLGYTTFDNNTGNHTYPDLTGDKTVITHAGNMAFKKGILVLNSAGNEGATDWHYISTPADGDDVLAIGAVNAGDTITDFSGRGPNANGRIKPDICAQGAASAVVLSNYNISTSNGTSFSCPIMAGCVASLWSAFPEKSAADIRDAIMISSSHFWTPDNNHGYGTPNFYNAYLFLKTNYNGNVLRVSDDVLVYPNPFGNELNISLFNNNDFGKTNTIEIFNLLGQKVYSTEIYLREKTFSAVQLDGIKTLQAGEYVLRLNGEKNFIHKLMKVK